MRVALRDLFPSKSWIICFEILRCYQKARQQPVGRGIGSVCLKTRARLLRGNQWRLTGRNSWGQLWLTAISHGLCACVLQTRLCSCTGSRTPHLRHICINCTNCAFYWLTIFLYFTIKLLPRCARASVMKVVIGSEGSSDFWQRSSVNVWTVGLILDTPDSFSPTPEEDQSLWRSYVHWKFTSKRHFCLIFEIMFQLI